MGVRGFSVVHIPESTPDADNGGGELFFPEEPTGNINLVNALVTEVTIAVVPNPVPVVVELLAKQIELRGRTAPEVEVDAFGDWLGATDLFDGTPRFVAGSAAVLEFPERIPFQPFDGGFESAGGTALGSALDNSVIFQRSSCELSSFPNGVGYRFFDVDIFSRLCGPDGGEGVPMIGCSNHYGVDVLALEEAANIAVGCDGLSGVVRLLFKDGFTVGDAFSVDVAEGDETRIFGVQRVLEDAGATSADADSRNADGVIGTLSAQERCGCEERCGGCCGDVAEE